MSRLVARHIRPLPHTAVLQRLQPHTDQQRPASRADLTGEEAHPHAVPATGELHSCARGTGPELNPFTARAIPETGAPALEPVEALVGLPDSAAFVDRFDPASTRRSAGRGVGDAPPAQPEVELPVFCS